MRREKLRNATALSKRGDASLTLALTLTLTLTLTLSPTLTLTLTLALALTLALSLALALALALALTRYVSVSSGGELNEVGRMMESMAAADASPLPVDLEVALRPPGDQREL